VIITLRPVPVAPLGLLPPGGERPGHPSGARSAHLRRPPWIRLCRSTGSAPGRGWRATRS